LEPALARRIRIAAAELEAILAGVDPDVVLPLLDHGQDPSGRPYLLVAAPGEPAATADSPDPAKAAWVLAEGLRQLAERGLIGSPPAPHRIDGGYVLGTPLPPVLHEVLATYGVRSRHEPAEVLAGGGWTLAGQVYACAVTLVPLTEQGSHAREVLRRQLVAEPGERLENPHALAEALAAALPSPTDPAVPAPAVEGRPLGSRYVLGEPIGRGATGVVWSARRREDATPVAVKLLRSELAADPTVVARFLRERIVMVNLRHPHLVRVHDLVAEGDVLGIVMDLVTGEDLRRRIGHGRMEITEAAALLSQIGDALAAVHDAGLVHRDVKPENVLLTERDGATIALLSDFGITRAVEGSSHTETIGTPTYMAPELAAGRPPAPAVDVYSLGITAYELLAGRPPFSAPTVAALLHAHLSSTAARPDGLPNEVWELIEGCLRKQPDARPKAHDVAFRWAHLAGLARSGSLPAAAAVVLDTSDRPLVSAPKEPEPLPPKEPEPDHHSRQSRRGRRPLTATVAIMAVLGLGGGAALAILRDGGDKPSAAASTASGTHPVPATARLADSVVTVSWRRDAMPLPGLTGFMVLDVLDNQVRPVSNTLPQDVTTFAIPDPRPGQQSCFLVVALGVTATPQDPPAQPACVTP